MKEIFSIFITILLFITITCNAFAVSIDAGKFKFGINAYLDFETTWMSEMPMAMTNTAGDQTGMLMTMSESFAFDQNHLNLIFNAKYKKTSIHLNYEARHSYSTFDGDTGTQGRSGPTHKGTDDQLGSFRIAGAYRSGIPFSSY